jgi:hypothetical protein
MFERSAARRYAEVNNSDGERRDHLGAAEDKILGVLMNNWKAIRTGIAASSLAIIAANQASAGETINLGTDASITIGAAVRASIRSTDGDTDGFLESARILSSGQFNKIVGFTLNTEIESKGGAFPYLPGDPDDIRILDAVARFEFNDYFNVWAGRMVLAADRSNLDGPYYLGIWDYPIVSAFPSNFNGRDTGITVWGQTGGGKFKYYAGAFEGCRDDNPCATGAAGHGDLYYVGRVSYNFWDPEPGYFVTSDYYGKKEILSIGVSANYQNNATGTAQNPGDYFGWSIDGLMQKKVLGGNVLTFEGSYYHYDTDNKETTLVNGDGYFVLASFLIDHDIGPGKLQPVIRYEELHLKDANDLSRLQAGVNYIIRGSDAKVSLLYSNTDFNTPGANKVDQFIAGLQLQY